jgi:hypothetical protein
MPKGLIPSAGLKKSGNSFFESNRKQGHGDVFFLCPLIAQSKGRFKTAHMEFHLSAKVKPEVRRFATALYVTLF